MKTRLLLLLLTGLFTGLLLPAGIVAQAPPAETPGTPPVQIRGAMVTPFATANDLRALAALGANHIRWQLTWGGFPFSPADTASPESYLQWLRGNLQWVKSMLPLCDSLGLWVVIDLHTLPGGRFLPNDSQKGHRLFHDARFQKQFLEIWQEIPLLFRHQKAIWGYDLANEPIAENVAAGLLHWPALAAKATAQVTALDYRRKIVIESEPGAWEGALPALKPFRISPNEVYSFHMYTPPAFTHQTLYGHAGGIAYPGLIEGKYWNRDSLKTHLQPVRDWQLLHNVPLYVGEFSAIRWAPGTSAYQYLSDCLSTFEGWNWNWCYHAWREWEGWSLEHNNDSTSHEQQETDRLELFRKAFKEL